MKRAFLSHADDNVATLLEDVAGEAVELIGAPARRIVVAAGAIPQAHKIAVRAIDPDSAVVKYGVAIGVATRKIAEGGWVHLHNCRSQVDERSAKFEGGTEKEGEGRYA